MEEPSVIYHTTRPRVEFLNKSYQISSKATESTGSRSAYKREAIVYLITSPRRV